MKAAWLYMLYILLLIIAFAFLDGIAWWRSSSAMIITMIAFAVLQEAQNARREPGDHWRIRNPFYLDRGTQSGD
jgi:lysylphosphatidylglycerol synthetase-like protein (DUF2156 family)